MKRRKLKIKNIIIFLVIIVAIIISLVKYIGYLNSYDYKLKKVGYNKEEIYSIESYLKDDEIDKVLNIEYNSIISSIIKEKYFLFKNLNKYIDYYKENEELKTNEIVTIINTNIDKDFYNDIKASDTTKGILTLVNKYYKLDKNFLPNNIVKMGLQYAYDNNEIQDIVYENFVDLCNAAKNEKNYIIVATSSYRDYEFQDYLYERYKNDNGQKYADTIAARPGHSEHQLGLALDVVAYQRSMDEFKDTDEFIWMKENAHKYGFILRYPEDKENITGYSYEPWHYRYVGVDVATYIHENNITFDEYYAYFIEK